MDTEELERLAQIAFEDGRRQQAYWEQHARHLKQEYPNQFVVVHDGEVVATGADLREVVKIAQRKGVDMRQTWIRFFESPPRILVL